MYLVQMCMTFLTTNWGFLHGLGLHIQFSAFDEVKVGREEGVSIFYVDIGVVIRTICSINSLFEVRMFDYHNKKKEIPFVVGISSCPVYSRSASILPTLVSAMIVTMISAVR